MGATPFLGCERGGYNLVIGLVSKGPKEGVLNLLAQGLGFEELGLSVKGVVDRSGRDIDSNQLGLSATSGSTEVARRDAPSTSVPSCEEELGGSQYVSENDEVSSHSLLLIWTWGRPGEEVDGIELAPGQIGRELSLVIHPLACSTMFDLGEDSPAVPQGENEHKDELTGLEDPSIDAVSEWVLRRISEVNRSLGVSFEGHETEALRLFIVVETSWRQGVPIMGELRNLECSVNYDHGGEIVGRCSRRE
ncbi:hypothetical protein CsSME_00048925 [Camellia sinensis var. sinensis]